MTEVTPELLAVLVCPRCRSSLVVEATSLRCVACSLQYQVIDGIPDMMVPRDAEPSSSTPDGRLRQPR
jgi:uncharacterized protein YbaR (Trm112 family)